MTARDIRPRCFDSMRTALARTRENDAALGTIARETEKRLRAAGENRGGEAGDEKKGRKERETMDDEEPCVVRKAR